MEIIVQHSKAVCELPWRPKLWFAWGERLARNRVGNKHNSVVGRAIKKFLAGVGPFRVGTSAGRDLPLPARTGKRAHINFPVSAFVRIVGEPAAIRRE